MVLVQNVHLRGKNKLQINGREWFMKWCIRVVIYLSIRYDLRTKLGLSEHYIEI